MYEEEFPIRLAKLRIQKGVSARDMSLSLGQNPGYINNIESGKALPSMASFFYICEYLDITPGAFFDMKVQYPEKTAELIENIQRLSAEQFRSIAFIIDELVNK